MGEAGVGIGLMSIIIGEHFNGAAAEDGRSKAK
jgi:hypothetical protein